MSDKEKKIWEPIKGLTKREVTDLARPDLGAVYNKWVEIKGELENTERFDAYLDELKRWWAIETGIIENLYTLSEGATKTLVEEGFKASLISRDDTNMEPAELVNVLRSHTDGIDFVMDLISGERGLTVGTIKELHALITKHQKTTKAIDPRGNLIEIPLVRGEYKQMPNDPTDADGVMYVYCPPEQVAQEMERLVDYYNSFKEAPPEVISAFLHHRFTQIHPFQDGNGRVARYLANLVFIKGGYLPLVVTRNERAEYIKALEKANSGAPFSLRTLIDFFAEIEKSTLIGAISLGQERLSAEKEIGTILDALREKRVEKAKERERRLNGVEQQCDELSRRAADRLRTVAKEVEKKFDDAATRVIVSEPGKTDHYFNRQIIMLKPSKSWVDTKAPVYWARLHIKTERQKFDLIITFFNIGKPASGLVGAVAFYGVRYVPLNIKDEDVEDVTIMGMQPIQIGPFLTFTADQSIQELERSFGKWLNDVSVEAIRIWADSVS